jgi:Xaa-Pro dipeptidase
MWTKEQIDYHKQAAKNLDKIKDLTFNYIKRNSEITEYEIQQFILKKIEECSMQIDNDPPIVAFDEDSATPEFYPKKESRRLKPNTFILIDLWAKLKKKDAPFADITWVAYYGKNIPEEIKKIFNLAIDARENTLRFINDNLKNKKLPIGKEADGACSSIIINAGYKENILHNTGHSLGIIDDHGPEKNSLNKTAETELSMNLGYTIEPGIYLRGKFGVRIEMDFYIDKNYNLIITTPLQKEIVII